jgi:hypothetical protein
LYGEFCKVDSFCIDKSSSAELLLAINSMFSLYQNAVKCYVYLSDASTHNVDICFVLSRDSGFRRSRWFTLGCTLQGLLAPASVEIFSKERELLGYKKSLKQLLCNITGVLVMVLEGTSLYRFGTYEWLL